MLHRSACFPPAVDNLRPSPLAARLSLTRLQDAHTVQLGVEDRKDYSFFAVFDGHGGSLVSQTSAQRVLDKILATPEWKADSATPEGIGRAMVRGFLDMDEDLRRVSCSRRQTADDGETDRQNDS